MYKLEVIRDYECVCVKVLGKVDILGHPKDVDKHAKK